jgi:hypothetical protein
MIVTSASGPPPAVAARPDVARSWIVGCISLSVLMVFQSVHGRHENIETHQFKLSSPEYRESFAVVIDAVGAESS